MSSSDRDRLRGGGGSAFVRHLNPAPTGKEQTPHAELGIEGGGG